MARHTYLLLARRATEIPIVPIPQAGQKALPFAQFCPSCRDIAGKRPKQTVKKHRIHQKGTQTVKRGKVNQNIRNVIQKIQNDSTEQKRQTQRVKAVSPVHKTSKHKHHHKYYTEIFAISKGKRRIFTICLRFTPRFCAVQKERQRGPFPMK